jgi:hypothetical protein
VPCAAKHSLKPLRAQCLTSQMRRSMQRLVQTALHASSTTKRGRREVRFRRLSLEELEVELEAAVEKKDYRRADKVQRVLAKQKTTEAAEAAAAAAAAEAAVAAAAEVAGAAGVDTQLGEEVAQLKATVAQLKATVAELRVEMEQRLVPLDELKATVAELREEMEERLVPLEALGESEEESWEESDDGAPFVEAEAEAVGLNVETYMYYQEAAHTVDEEGKTPLYHAAKAGNVVDVEEQLKVGADVDKASDNGMTPLAVVGCGETAGTAAMRRIAFRRRGRRRGRLARRR